MIRSRSSFPRSLQEAFGPYAEWHPEPDPLWYVISRFLWSIIL